jgi:uncharacterized protein YydD (DUF2326 family)
MYLKSLILLKGNDEVIREISFHAGLNLIVDETPVEGEKLTGNNVGKTTVLALIDFCLGGSSKNIYTDPENRRTEYALVKNFLIEKEVRVILTLVESLDEEKSGTIQIERNFLSRKSTIRKINDIPRTESEFDDELTNLLFPGQIGKKPTYRQIISHNIRYKDLSIQNTLKTLDRYTSDAEYETLHLFMLGCDVSDGETKQNLISQIKIENKFHSRLEQQQTKSAYETALALLNQDIRRLNARKSRLGLSESFEEDIDTINTVKYKINFVSAEINELSLRQSVIQEAQKELDSGSTQIDHNQLQQIYSQATTHLDSVQKSFKELVNFHNRMIEEKVKYITKELPEIAKRIASKREMLNRLLEEERRLSIAIAQGTSFSELEKLVAELNEKHQKKGELEKTINQLNEVEDTLSELNRRLEEIDNNLFSNVFESQLKAQLNKFNTYFAAVSERLYEEQYALKVDPITKKGQRIYKFSSFNTNFSSGKKQGEISCFDIAYTLFADDEEIPCLHFLLNDKKELMHNNQLVNIAKLVVEKNIQFVAAILKDKLPSELNDDSYFIVKLSPNEKLFKIES